ncbi:ABC transporter permease subunit [Cylindrospermum sp. FACHB-282]|uniref:ABC transporter permease subunit n=1 Tax=Cylindrospermum sp. FACHB-282 TaxID=2692794 RepID=UPI001684D87F|nr:ABC transporter permease subunit [Cylindrospermum sp. FACHB-282]MBD2384067.1 ABC transporter permease subunit [Cylindrospermum sp. FACHB-282]
MMLNFVDKVGEWNPQLFRELKGRLKTFNVAIALVSSLLLQLVIFLYQLTQLPDEKYALTDNYCRLRTLYEQQQTHLYQQQDALNQKISNYQQIQLADLTIIPNLKAQLQQVRTELTNLQNYISKNVCPQKDIDWQLWWKDHWEYTFLSISVIFVFTLIVAGTFLLISDLAKEEHRGTLNFIRLSPQSEASILTGKLLGVPCLIYLFILTAIPLHLWAGHSAGIATSHLFSYYAILSASCFFFYSAALFFGLISRFFSSFQPWLGTAAIFMFLFITMVMASSSVGYSNNPTAWLRMLSPWDMINHLFPNFFNNHYGHLPLGKLQFFYLPIGANLVSLVGFNLVNYGICTYGIWQAMKRCFRNPNATILSKKQSYLFVACLQVILLGLAMQDSNNTPEEAIIYLGLFNFVISLALIAILSPHRQTIQDWARYRHQNVSDSKSDKRYPLWQDLMLGEKSPAILAIAINLVITTTPIMVWIVLTPDTTMIGDYDKIKAILAVALSVTLMMIYATIAQIMLLMKNRKRSFWAIGTIATAIFLPPIILSYLSISPSDNPAVWLFSTFPWVGIEYAQTITIFKAFLAELTVLTLLNFRLTKQVKLAGESATKALLAAR